MAYSASNQLKLFVGLALNCLFLLFSIVFFNILTVKVCFVILVSLVYVVFVSDLKMNCIHLLIKPTNASD